MRVPFLNIQNQNQYLAADLREAFESVIKHGMFIGGKEIELFEAEIERLTKSNYCIGVNSGTDALVLSLKALNIGVGSEVITVGNSWISTANAIRIVGANPVFCKLDSNGLMDPHGLRDAITERTKALIPVHLMGMPCRMKEIMDIASEFDLAVVEDCAQAICATIDGRHVGRFGSVGCFSAHPLKNLSALGDAGFITTDDLAIRNKLLRLRNHGLLDRDSIIDFGLNSRLDTLQAAFLLKKIPLLESITANRRKNAKIYYEGLAPLVEKNKLKVPEEREGVFSVYHTFIIRVAYHRTALAEFLDSHGVETKIHYPKSIVEQPEYINCPNYGGSLVDLSNEILSLPVHEGLSIEQVKFVVNKIVEFFNTELGKES